MSDITPSPGSRHDAPVQVPIEQHLKVVRMNHELANQVYELKQDKIELNNELAAKHSKIELLNKTINFYEDLFSSNSFLKLIGKEISKLIKLMLKGKASPEELLVRIKDIVRFKNQSERRSRAEGLGAVSKGEAAKNRARAIADADAASQLDTNDQEDEATLPKQDNTVFSFENKEVGNHYEHVTSCRRQGMTILDILNNSPQKDIFDFKTGSDPDGDVYSLNNDSEQMHREIAEQKTFDLIEKIDGIEYAIMLSSTGVQIIDEAGTPKSLHSKGLHRVKIINASSIEHKSLVLVPEYSYVNPDCDYESSDPERLSLSANNISGSKFIFRLSRTGPEFDCLLDLSDEKISEISQNVSKDFVENNFAGLTAVRELRRESVRIREQFYNRIYEAIYHNDKKALGSVVNELLKVKYKQICKYGRLESAVVQPSAPLVLFSRHARTMVSGASGQGAELMANTLFSSFSTVWYKSSVSVGLISSAVSSFVGFNTSKNAVYQHSKQGNESYISQPHVVNLINAVGMIMSLSSNASLKVIRDSKLIMMDEVTSKLLEDGAARVKYNFSLMNGRASKERHVCICYTGSREFRHIVALLNANAAGFSAVVLHTDGFIGYKKFIRKVAKTLGITHCQCISHARRAFVRAMKDSGLMAVYESLLEVEEQTNTGILMAIERAFDDNTISEVQKLILMFVHLIRMLFSMEKIFISDTPANEVNKFRAPEFMEKLSKQRQDTSSILFFLADSIITELADVHGLAVRTSDGKSYRQSEELCNCSYFSNAVVYWMNHRNNLKNFLENPEVELSTNAIERAHRGLVVSYNHFHYMNTVGGSQAFANLITAKQNCIYAGVDLKHFIEYVLLEYIKARQEIFKDEELIEQINSDYRELSGLEDFDIRDEMWLMPGRRTQIVPDPETGLMIKVVRELSDPVNPSTFILKYINVDVFNPYVYKRKMRGNGLFSADSHGFSKSSEVKVRTDSESTSTVSTEQDKAIAEVTDHSPVHSQKGKQSCPAPDHESKPACPESNSDSRSTQNVQSGRPGHESRYSVCAVQEHTEGLQPVGESEPMLNRSVLEQEPDPS